MLQFFFPDYYVLPPPISLLQESSFLLAPTHYYKGLILKVPEGCHCNTLLPIGHSYTRTMGQNITFQAGCQPLTKWLTLNQVTKLLNLQISLNIDVRTRETLISKHQVIVNQQIVKNPSVQSNIYSFCICGQCYQLQLIFT